jgi:hypothetical protein
VDAARIFVAVLDRDAPSALRPSLEHDPEKACPGLDPGWKPVFEQDHAQKQRI